jgi:MurNAc alpha-1-phosphate uridylyltransferase
LKAMILAAGRGERMRPLTDSTPKPLLLVGGRPLIEYHLQRLAQAGVNEVVINTAYLGDQIQARLGDVFNVSDSDFNMPTIRSVDYPTADHISAYAIDTSKPDQNKANCLSILYSSEPEPLETAGAILHALPLLGEAPFLLINGDVWTDYPFESLLSHYSAIGTARHSQHLAHVVLVDNPEHNVTGDFSMVADNGEDTFTEGSNQVWVNAYLSEKHDNAKAHTFSGISVINPKLVTAYPDKREKFPLAEILHFGVSRQQISAEIYTGQWRDIGTIERLQALDDDLNREQKSK